MLRSLSKGVSGSDVRAWQEFLTQQGFNPGPIDGIFGPGTHKATIAFQKNRNLGQDGIVGQATIAMAQLLGYKPKLLVITQPINNISFPLNHAVDVIGLVDPQIITIEVILDSQFSFPPVTLANGAWMVANRIRESGRKQLAARGLDASGTVIDTDTTNIYILAQDYRTEVPIPSSINPRVQMV